MLVLFSSLPGRKKPVVRHEILSLSDLDDHILRDIGLRRTDLYAAPAERLRPVRRTGAARRWAELVSRLSRVFAREPVPCCQS